MTASQTTMASPALGTPAHKHWLVAARVAWVVTFILALGFVVAVFPVRYASAYQQAASIPQDVSGNHLLTPDVYAGVVTLLDVCVMLEFTIAAILLFWRKSNSWLGVFVSLTLILFGASITTSSGDPAMLGPQWTLLVNLFTTFGLICFLIFLYVFPDGRFVPWWTSRLAVAYVLWWTVFWLAAIFIPNNPLMQSVAFQYVSSLLWFGTGVFAQLYRRRCKINPVELLQTKWITYGMSVAFVGYFISFGAQVLFQNQGGAPNLMTLLIFSAIGSVSILIVPISISFSVMRYRLWDIDPIIHRTVVYGVLTALMGILYLVLVALLQSVFRMLTGQQSDLAIVVSTLAIAALVRPMGGHMQGMIDRRFYRERVDFRRAFEMFSREVRTIIDLPELLRALVNRITELWHISYGAVFLRDPNGTFYVPDARPLTHEELSLLSLTDEVVERMELGINVLRTKNAMMPLLVPLFAPRGGKREIVGVLTLGPRLSAQAYTRADLMLLSMLADQAGTAIYVAQLILEKQSEAQRREEAEERLEAYRNSPTGQAELFARTLLSNPNSAVQELHSLVQKADQDPNAASLIGHLPKTIQGPGVIVGLAEGFSYLYDSLTAPELIHLALRTLVTEMEKPEAASLQHAAETLAVYKLSQSALNASSITQITQLMVSVENCETICADCVLNETNRAKLDHDFFLANMVRWLTKMKMVIEILRSYERVDTPADKLAYLVSAVERLSKLDRIARTDLGVADRAIIRRITDSWLSVVTGAMSDLQTRAQIVCRLLTRHTWQDDIVSLALSIQNTGQGAAENVRVSLAPSPEYTLIDDVARVDCLSPDEETQVELRVRPRLAQGVDQFRARFIIQYGDPRGPDQVENFADVVYLVSTASDFQFIPNPYVVGTPLQTGSRLFFGREDIVAFVQENLEAAHHNNLVLIGQRRTGKTSLLKQLPARLGDKYFPVYIDGQTLGLDPGLPNFFLNLATEIAFALDDRGFEITPPELSDFIDSPAATFEHKFIARTLEVIGDRHLLILFDEFEELEAAVNRGNLDSSVFSFLRHLIQHTERVSVIFCGTHRMEELASDYWSVLFNISLYKDVGFLDKDESLRLIQEPVAEYGMKYDDLALDKMWRVTAGHPYFLQLLCHSLVNRHNRLKRSYLTVTDVNAALEEILASGEAHFVYLWTESTSQERLALTALSRMIPITGSATPVQMVDYLTERGINIERREISEAMHRLAMRDILRAGSDTDTSLGDTYRWRLGLLGLWAEKYKSLSRIMDEVRQ